MASTRRAALLAGAALVPGWVAGCLAGGSNVRYPRTEAESPSAGAALRGDGDADARATDAADDGGREATRRTVPNPELARGTTRILDELRWFAVERDRAVEAYLKAMRRAARRVDDLRGEEAAFDDDALSTLHEIVDGALGVAREVIGDHFGTDELIAENVGYHLGVVEKFHRRGDRDRTDEELVRLRDFFRSVGSEPYADRYLSSRPVRNRLFDRLRGDGTGPVLFEVRYLPTEYAARAYDRRRRWRRYSSGPLGGYGRGSLGAFEPLAVSEGREDAAFVRPRSLPDRYADETADRSDDPGTLPAPPEEPHRHPGVTVFLQRFSDADAAGEALGSLLDDRIEQEGTYRFGADAWRRVYYRFGGDVVYAFLAQAGETLLATAPSEIAWEERVDWNEPLTRCWLRRDPASDERERLAGGREVR